MNDCDKHIAIKLMVDQFVNPVNLKKNARNNDELEIMIKTEIELLQLTSEVSQQLCKEGPFDLWRR